MIKAETCILFTCRLHTIFRHYGRNNLASCVGVQSYWHRLFTRYGVILQIQRFAMNRNIQFKRSCCRRDKQVTYKQSSLTAVLVRIDRNYCSFRRWDRHWNITTGCPIEPCRCSIFSWTRLVLITAIYSLDIIGTWRDHKSSYKNIH